MNDTHTMGLPDAARHFGVSIRVLRRAMRNGTIPAPAAIIAAIEDALSPFGVQFAESPLTPDRIVAALKAARQAPAA